LRHQREEIEALELDDFLDSIDINISMASYSDRTAAPHTSVSGIGIINNASMPCEASPTVDRSLQTQDHSQQYLHPRAPCGLWNEGSICYMTSTLQQCFMLPSFRDYIFSLHLKENPTHTIPQVTADFSESRAKKVRESLEQSFEFMKQLQQLFLRLQHSPERAIDPAPLYEAMRDPADSNLPLDINIQRDASEFLSTLFAHVGAVVTALGSSYETAFRNSIAGTEPEPSCPSNT
jgi:hypothetical protein